MMPTGRFGNKTRKRLRFDKNRYNASKSFPMVKESDLIRDCYDDSLFCATRPIVPGLMPCRHGLYFYYME
jgi:hypothetical protein